MTAAPIDLRAGRWQDVLQDVTCDALIVDAPYSERTHEAATEIGYRKQDAFVRADGRIKKAWDGGRRPINYEAWANRDVFDFCAYWSNRVTGWIVSITDHSLAPVWQTALEAGGRYVFAPLPFVETGSRVRLAGDGPSSWTCWVVVARPRTREYQQWGTLRGAYISTNERKPVIGGKPLGLMRALVRDYSRPGDLICDPCAGGGTTLLAAAIEGRRAVGAECMPEHFEIASKRITQGFTPTLFDGSTPPSSTRADAPRAEQASLFAESGTDEG